MKITSVKGYPIESNLIVKIDTDQGIYGIGEAGLAPQIPATMKVLDYFADWLVGRDASDIEGIWQALFRHTRRKEGIILISAISGIDMALWDIKGKSLNAPVWKLLGGKARERVSLYTHIGGTGIDETIELAVRARPLEIPKVKQAIDVHVRPDPPPSSTAQTGESSSSGHPGIPRQR